MTAIEQTHDAIEIHTTLIEAAATVDVIGLINPANVFVVQSFLDAAISSGALELIVRIKEIDLSHIESMRRLVEVARRLVALDGYLVLESTSAVIDQLSRYSELGSLMGLRMAEFPHNLGTTADFTTATSQAGEARDEESAADVRMHKGVSTSVDGALQLLVNLARVTVGGAEGVSVSLWRQGHLSTIASSDKTISAMDAGQYLVGQGPCVDAATNGRWFHSEAITREERWPNFTPTAISLGINSILSLPLLAQGNSVGALNMYATTEFAFTPPDQEIASIFAREASSILTFDEYEQKFETLSHQIARSLRRRRTISQAEGVIMERGGLSADDAYSVLREISQRTGQPLREAASDVLHSTTGLGEMPRPQLGADDDG